LDTGFFGISFIEFLLIAAIALIIVGPDRIPEYARKLGKLVRDFRRMTTNLTGEMKKAIDLDNNETASDLKKTFSGITTALDEEARAIKLSLDAEAAEIAKAMSTEGKGLEQTLSESSNEISDILKKEASIVKSSADELKNALDKEIGEFTKTLSDGKKKLDKTLGIEEKKTAPTAAPAATGQPAKPENKAPEAPQPVQEPAPEPVSTGHEGGS